MFQVGTISGAVAKRGSEVCSRIEASITHMEGRACFTIGGVMDHNERNLTRDRVRRRGLT
jgi:hypothetical protein